MCVAHYLYTRYLRHDDVACCCQWHVGLRHAACCATSRNCHCAASLGFNFAACRLLRCCLRQSLVMILHAEARPLNKRTRHAALRFGQPLPCPCRCPVMICRRRRTTLSSTLAISIASGQCCKNTSMQTCKVMPKTEQLIGIQGGLNNK